MPHVPAIYAALQAGEKGLPFIPLRGLDRHRYIALSQGLEGNRQSSSLQAIQSCALPAIRPDVALFHARCADREGNVFIGREREVLLMAHAAKTTLVTVEEIVEGNLLEDPARGGAVLPSIYVSAVAVAKRGAWPIALFDLYPMDDAAIARYIGLARSAEGIAQFLGHWDGGEEAAA
jgi:glutaconate CoA-transferase subunit A